MTSNYELLYSKLRTKITEHLRYANGEMINGKINYKKEFEIVSSYKLLSTYEVFYYINNKGEKYQDWVLISEKIIN